MRKIHLLTAVLMLALCLFLTSGALAGGVDPQPDFTLSNYVAHTFALFEDDPSIGLSHADHVGQIWINNYDYWAGQLEGVPQWSLSYETDKGVVFAYETWEYSGNEGFSMGVSQYPPAPVTVAYTVTCTWGNYTQSYESSLAFETLPSIPKRFTISGHGSDTLRLQAGKETNLQFRYDPADFSFSDRDLVYFSLPSYDLLQQVGGQGHDWVIKPLQTGVFDCELGLVSGNITMARHYRLDIRDNYTLSHDLPETFAIFDDDSSIGLQHGIYMGQLWINDFDYWTYLMDGGPQWSFTAECDTSSEGDILSLEVLEQGRSAALSLAQYPRGLKPITYTVSCVWGGVKRSYSGTLTFNNPASLPTGFICEQADENGVIHLDLYRRHTLTFTFLPDSFAYGQQVDLAEIRYPDNHLDVKKRIPGPQSFSMEVIPTSVDNYSVLVKLRSANIVMKKEFQIVVAAPEHEFSLSPTLSNVFATHEFFSGNSDIEGLWCDDYMGRIALTDAEYWGSTLSGEPQWTFKNQNGKGGRINFDAARYPQFIGGFLHLVSYPSDYSPVRYTIICDWDGYHAEYQGELHFETPDAPPVDILLDGGEDSSFSMTLGMERALHFVFKPSPNSTGSFYIDGVRLLDFLCDEEYLEHVDEDGYTLIAKPLQTGTTTFSLSLKMGNVVLTKEYTAHIVDGPIPIFMADSIYRDLYFAPGPTPNANRIASSNEIFTIQLNNYDEMMAAYGPDNMGNWILEYVSGPSFDCHLQPRGNNRVSVMLHEWPDSPGLSVYRAICNWGGCSASMLLQFDFMEAELPSGILLDGERNRNVYFMKKGESQTFTVSLQNSGDFTASGIGVSNVDKALLTTAFRGMEITITPQATGAIPLTLNVMTKPVSGSNTSNIRVISEMVLLVTEDGEWTSLDLPKSLTEIGDEAFMGTNANLVTIQGKVKTIGARAFADSPNLMSVNLPSSLTFIDPTAFSKDVVMIASTENLFSWAIDNGFHCLYLP